MSAHPRSRTACFAIQESSRCRHENPSPNCHQSRKFEDEPRSRQPPNRFSVHFRWCLACADKFCCYHLEHHDRQRRLPQSADGMREFARREEKLKRTNSPRLGPITKGPRMVSLELRVHTQQCQCRVAEPSVNISGSLPVHCWKAICDRDSKPDLDSLDGSNRWRNGMGPLSPIVR